MPILARTPPPTHQPPNQEPNHLKRHPRGFVTRFHRTATNALIASCLLAFATGVTGGQANDASRVARSPSGPEAALPEELQTIEVRSASGMVAAGSPEAARAGALMLERGGNAVDAAVAAAFAVGVVNPLDAGLGGQAYVLIHLRDGRNIAIDGSSPLPLRMVPEDIKPLKESGFLYGYKLAATPATPAALARALEQYGTMSLAQVLAPAIELADFGHVVMPHVQGVINGYAGAIRESEFLARTFLKDGLKPWPPGHVYCQPVLAETMRRLAIHGVEDFYRGQIAQEIAADMAANGGYVSRLDLALLHVTERVPVGGRYRGLEVVAFPSPGGGDIVVETLQILDTFPQELLRHESADRMHLLLEAVRIAFRDAGSRTEASFLGTAFLDPTRAERRAALIRFDRALREEELPTAENQYFNDRGTSHVSVVDRFGNAVSFTQTLGYGGFVATPSLGFQHNSLLETLEFCDRKSPNFPVPLRVLQTTMTPTMLLCDGKPFLVLGGPGSSRIPSSIVAVVTNVVDRAMTLAEAVAAPRVLVNRPNPINPEGCRPAPTEPPPEPRVFLEIAGPITSGQADDLEARGFTEQYRKTFPLRAGGLRAFGGINAVMVDPATGLLVGVGDPRRQGAAAAPVLP
jgi:gamma-glutamyltranspeptidase/glutathione hydrolase